MLVIKINDQVTVREEWATEQENDGKQEASRPPSCPK